MRATTGQHDEQVVVLELAGESYGVEIGKVHEIIRMQSIVRVPNCPAGMEGVTNLRGRVIPVLDLRGRFGLDRAATTRRSRIVVAEVGEHTVGLIVDAVSEVLPVPDDAVEPPSALVATADSAFLRGVAKIDDRLVLLIEPARLLFDAHVAEMAA